MFNPTQQKLNHQEVRVFLEEVLIHPIPMVRRELLDYLLRVQGVKGFRNYSLTLNLNGNIKILELTPPEVKQLSAQVLDTTAHLPIIPHPTAVQDLQNHRCTLLRGSLALGVSVTKAKALRKGIHPTRTHVAPIAAIFLASLKGTPRKEVALKFGVTAQTVSNVRSRFLDKMLYYAVREFVDDSKVA